MSPIFAELNRWLSIRYQWGENDCVTLCGDWVQRIRGVDPAADIRMTYSSAAECQRVTRFFTDPIGAVSGHLANAGLIRTDAARVGDVGVILLQTEPGVARPHMAMKVGASWAFKTVDGSVLSVQGPKVAAAWGVGYENP